MEVLKFTYNLEDYIFEYNREDPSSLGCIREIVTNNDYILENFVNNSNKHFIDIGANCGVATIILAKQNPLSIIYSFEPDRQLFKVLQNNIIKNNLTNVKAFNMAVSKYGVNKLTLCLDPRYSGGNTTYSNIDTFKTFHNNSNISSYEVNCISLDEVINENNITEIELLKIDCEGAEYDILYTSAFLRNKCIKNMVGEFHNLKYNTLVEETGENLIEYCKPFIKNILKVSVLNIN
jgi:FkbM family methyltransferase